APDSSYIRSCRQLQGPPYLKETVVGNDYRGAWRITELQVSILFSERYVEFRACPERSSLPVRGGEFRRFAANESAIVRRRPRSRSEVCFYPKRRQYESVASRTGRGEWTSFRWQKCPRHHRNPS